MEKEKKSDIVRCDKLILADLRKAVLNKYCKLYGMLKKEVDIALHERLNELIKEGY